MNNFLSEIDFLRHDGDKEATISETESYLSRIQICIHKDIVPDEIKYALFKLTDYCNSDCSYCVHAASKTKDLRYEISLEKIKGIFREFGEMGIKVTTLSGGEPLVRKDICEITEAAVGSGIFPVLLTNGVLLPGKIGDLYKAGMRYIIMSLDSFNADSYFKNRGISFEFAEKGFLSLVQMQRKHPDFSASITAVITRNNLSEIIDMTKRVTATGLGIQFSPYHHFNTSEPDVLSVDNFEYADYVFTELLEMKASGVKITNSVAYLKHFLAFFRNRQLYPANYRCTTGYTSIFIAPDLNVRSCWSWSLPVLGNLNTQSVKEIWYSETTEKQRKRMLKCQCDGCWLLCTAETNIEERDNDG